MQRGSFQVDLQSNAKTKMQATILPFSILEQKVAGVHLGNTVHMKVRKQKLLNLGY